MQDLLLHSIYFQCLDSKLSPHKCLCSSEEMDKKHADFSLTNPQAEIAHSHWHRLFRAFDTNHDGYIPTTDLKKAIREATFSFGLSDAEVIFIGIASFNSFTNGFLLH